MLEQQQEKAGHYHLRIRRRQVRMRSGATTVRPEEFLTRNDAADRLGKLSANWLVARGVLERAVLDDGSDGVTVRSVHDEIAWQQAATRGMKVRRSVTGVLMMPWMV